MADEEGAAILMSQVQLGVALTDIYNTTQMPMPFLGKLAEMWVCNTDAAVQTITLRIGTVGSSLTTANSLLEGASMPAKTTWRFGGGGLVMALNSGYMLQGSSGSANKITITLFGREQP